MAIRHQLHFGAASAPVGAATLRWIGNATMVLEADGIRLLADPNFLHAGDHAHIGYGMTTKRLKEPATSLAALPPVDAVLLSHYHGDHFDHHVEAELARDMPIVTTPHAAGVLSRKGFAATHALDTWETADLERGGRHVEITSMPGRHGPGPMSAVLPQVMGSMLTFAPAGKPPLRVYISGDTLIHDALREIPQRYPDIDIAVLHLGGTRVFGILVTLDGKGGVEAVRIVRPRTVIPVHYEEYTVMKSPLSDFLAAARDAGLSDRVTVVERGAVIDLYDLAKVASASRSTTN